MVIKHFINILPWYHTQVLLIKTKFKIQLIKTCLRLTWSGPHFLIHPTPMHQRWIFGLVQMHPYPKPCRSSLFIMEEVLCYFCAQRQNNSYQTRVTKPTMLNSSKKKKKTVPYYIWPRPTILQSTNTFSSFLNWTTSQQHSWFHICFSLQSRVTIFKVLF